MIAFFPPSLSPTLIISLAALSYTCRPVSTPPVNETARIPGCWTMPSPTTDPLPVTMFTTPGGKPAASRAFTNFAAERGVRDEGLNTMGQPAIRAAPDFHAGIATGKFHGVIRPTGPTGMRIVRHALLGSSEG